MATELKGRDIEQAVSSLFSKEEVEEVARETGFIRRERKINAWLLLWTLVLGFTVERRRSMASLRRVYERLSGETLMPSSFQDRFVAPLVTFLKRLAELALKRRVPTEARLRGMWSAFRDVVLADATVLKLHRGLKEVFRGTGRGSCEAAAKLNMVMSVSGGGPLSVRVGPETRNDGRSLSIGPWVKGRLLMMDLGYYSFQLFDRIQRNHGYFISRVKTGANPRLLKMLRAIPGRPIGLEGKKLKQVLPSLLREVLDAEAQVEFRRRTYKGRRSTGRLKLRLVGLRDSSSGRYHLYYTNVPAEMLTAEQVALSYSGRWLVELLFREMASTYRLKELDCANEHFVKASIYSCLLTLIVSRALLEAVKRRCRGAALYATPERWARLFSAIAIEIAELLTAPFVKTSRVQRALRMVLSEAPDVHLKRQGGLLHRLEFAYA